MPLSWHVVWRLLFSYLLVGHLFMFKNDALYDIFATFKSFGTIVLYDILRLSSQCSTPVQRSYIKKTKPITQQRYCQ